MLDALASLLLHVAAERQMTCISDLILAPK